MSFKSSKNSLGLKKSYLFFLITLLFVSWASSSWAKRFKNQYSEFELPSGWECALEGSEWVCQNTNKKRRKEAIIILAAKIRGEKDSLDQYQSYLKETKTFSLPGGKTQVSEPKYVKVKSINNQRWIDALHLASEVPGYYTRYLATVKEDLGVAITLTVSKEHYSEYQPIFDKIVDSIRVFRQRQVEVAAVQGTRKKEENLLGDGALIPDEDEKFDISAGGKAKRGTAKTGGESDMLLYLILGAGVVGFIIWKKRKAKQEAEESDDEEEEEEDEGDNEQNK